MSAIDFFTDPATGAAIDNGGYSDTQDRLEVDPFAWLDNPLIDTALCSGFGQYHTDHPDAKTTRKPYIGLSLAEIKQMMTAPKRVAKETAQWAIFSSYKNEYGRDIKQQRQHGQYYALWADIDEAKGVTCADIFSLTVEATGGAETWVYTSRSATEENQKARIILPLSSAVTGADFELLQEAFNNRLAAAGLIPDRVNESCNQVCYLPNRGEFYEYHITDPDEHQQLDVQLWAADIAVLTAEREREHSEAIERQARSKARMIELRKGQDFLPRSAANDAYDSKTLWITYGGKVRSGGRVLSPNSGTGAAGITFANDGSNKWFSKHGSDMALGIGQLSKDGASCFGDAFDLICFFDYGNDEKKAAAALSKELDAGGDHERKKAYAIAEQEAKDAAEAAAGLTGIADLAEPEDDPETPEVLASDIDLLKPTGLAGAICEYMAATARRPMPELYPLAALHLMALVGRKRKSQYADKLNLTTLGIALTAAGKDHAQQTVIELAQEHYCSNLIAGDAGSFKELILNQLDGDGAALYIIDEVHSFLGSMKSKNAATHETKMEAEILKLSTSKLYVFRGMEKRALKDTYEKRAAWATKQLDEGKGDVKDMENCKAKAYKVLGWLEDGLPDPFFGLMGHSVPENLDSFINLENIGSGFLGRALIVRCPDNRRELVRDIDASSHTLMLCKDEIRRGLNTVRRSDTEITATPEAQDYINQCIDWFESDHQRNHPVLGGIYARASEQVTRVASILALADGQISLSHAKYANALVKQSNKDVSYILLKAYAETGEAKESAVFESARQTIHRSCKGAGVTPSRLKQLVQKPKGWQALQAKDATRDIYSELLNRLIERGELERVEQGRSVRYVSRAVV